MKAFGNVRDIKVLLVDKSQFTQNTLKRAFESMGLRLLITESADEALRLLKKNSVDVILCDYSLPDMTGIDFFKRVLGSCRNTVKVMISSAGDDEIISRAYGIGVQDFLQKPFSPKTILATLELHIRKQLRQSRRTFIEPLIAA
jgi:DNA-binding response OmpR family regulator